jgi:uncharacterized protein YydD (DUF2326 family)
VEANISQNNTLAYNLKYEISQIQKSSSTKIVFDLDRTKELFDEAQLLFPNQLKKSFSELIEFNRKMTKERVKLLKNTLIIKSEQLKIIESQLEALNNKKFKAIEFLKETSAFKKFKEYQKQQITIEAELSLLKSKVEMIDKIIKLDSGIENIQKNINELVDKIKVELQKTEDNSIYSEIRKNFATYFKFIFDSNALLTLKLNKTDNVEFMDPIIRNDVKKATSEGDGYTYNKLMCVCFDLAVLATYSSQPFFHFVYHDDVLGNEDNGVKTRLLQLIDRVTSKNRIQYIYSIIRGDMPVDISSGQVIEPDDSKIILRLHDENETGTLFGFKF